MQDHRYGANRLDLGIDACTRSWSRKLSSTQKTSYSICFGRPGTNSAHDFRSIALRTAVSFEALTFCNILFSSNGDQSKTATLAMSFLFPPLSLLAEVNNDASTDAEVILVIVGSVVDGGEQVVGLR